MRLASRGRVATERGRESLAEIAIADCGFTTAKDSRPLSLLIRLKDEVTNPSPASATPPQAAGAPRTESGRFQNGFAAGSRPCASFLVTRGYSHRWASEHATGPTAAIASRS